MSKARSSTRASMASGSKSQDRRGSRMVDSSDDLKKLTASSAAMVVNIGEYEEKTKADLKEMLDGFDVHYASKATKPELLDLLEKALLSKYAGRIGEQNSPATESKSVSRSAKSGSKASKPTVTFRDSQITAREGDVPPPVYQLRSRDRSLSSRKLRRTTAESHIASNNSICIMKGEKVREIDNFLFYPARPASRDRSPSASSTRTRKSRTRSMRSSPSGSESTMDDQSNRSTQQSPELEGVSVADEMNEYNLTAYQADNVIMEGPYRAADNEDDRHNDNVDDRHDDNEGDEEGHHGDNGDDVDEDEDEFYDAADGSFLMDVVSPEYAIADPPVATIPVESHHSQAFLNEGQEQHVIAAPAADTCLRGVDDGASSVFDDDGEGHEDDEYEGTVDDHQSEEEEDNFMLGGNQRAYDATDLVPGFDGDMDEERVDQVDEEGAEPVAHDYASEEVDDGGDSCEYDARLEGNEEIEGEGDEVMDEEELESISDDGDEDESESDDPDHYDDEDDFDDDDGNDDDEDEEEEDRNEFDQHGDDEDISFAVNNASEVIDLLSSDDEDDVPCDRPASPSTVPEISAAVAASASVRDRSSVESAHTEVVIEGSAHTEVVIEGSCAAETKEGTAAGPTLDDYNGTLSSGPTNSAVAKLETVLNKLTRTFVSAVSSSLTAMGSTAATGEATKLSPEDYNFLKSILEKTKPDCEYSAPDLGREVPVPPISTTAVEAVQTKPVYFVDTTLSALDETDASKRNEGDNSYSSSIPQLSSSEKSTAPGQDTTGGSKVKLISFGEHDAVIPRSSYDGKSWTSRESFLPNTPSTPADPAATQELFTDQSSFHYQKDLFNAAAPILRRMPTPYYAPGSNKRSAFDAGFSESMIANAGNTPFSRTAPQSSSSGSVPPFQPMKRMSFDGYNASSYSGALQLTSSSNGNPSSSASLSRFQSRGIGTGEVAPTGLIPFQGRPSYTPAFRGSSAQVSSAPKSFPNYVLDNNNVVLNNASSESTLSANTAFNGASNAVSSSRSLSYIQRRRLQRDSITSQSAAMAQKILQTLSGIKSPIEQQRRKPVAITWRDEPDTLSTAQSSSSGPQSIAGSAQADHTKDVQMQGAAASHSSGSLGFKGQSTQQQQPVGANLQSPFLHSSLRQKSNSSTTITDSKNHPQQQKVSFSLPNSTVGRADSLSRTAAVDSRTATPTSSSSSSFTAEDQEFTFGDPMVVSGVEDVGDAADMMSSPTGEDGRAIKYMFSATKSKSKNHKASTVAPTQHKQTTVGLAANTATSAMVNNELATASPAINIWAASSINDGIKCKVCMVKNKKEATKCASCESPLESISISSTTVNNIWAASSINDGIKCKVCMVKNKKEAKKCASCESVLDVGSSADTVRAAEPQKQQLLGFSFGASPAADMSKKPTDFSSKASTTGFTFPSSSSTTSTHQQIISSDDQSRESSISKGGFVFNPSSVGTSAPAAVAAVQFGTFSRSAPVAAPVEESRKKVSFSSASNDSSRGSNDDESSDQPSKRKLHRGQSETTSAFSPTAFNGGFSTQAEPLHIGGSATTSNSAGKTVQTSQTPLFSFGSSVPTADAPKPFAFGVRSGGSNASGKELVSNGAALFKFDGVPANPLSSATTSSSSFNSFGATDRSSTSGFGISTTPSQSSVVNLSATSGDPLPPAAATASSNSSNSKPFMFGASDSQSSGNKPFTFNSSSSFSSATSDKTGLFSVTAFPALPSSSALVPSTTSTAGTAIAPFSFGSSVKSQSTTAFNTASADSKSTTLNVASSMLSSSSSLSAIGSSSGKPPLASVNPFGASSLLLPTNGVASVDQQQQPPISSTTAGTISPVPTFGVSVAGSNLVSMDSPGSTMDVGSIGSNLSVPSVPTFPSSAALPLSSSSFSFAGLAPPPSNVFSSTQPLAPKDALGSNAPLFGQQPSSVGAFGQQSASVGAFGQQPASAFGQQPSSVGAFGQQPSSGPFGQKPASVGAFGQQPSSVGAFGQQPSSVGAFGQQPSSVGAFGQQPSSVGAFGQQPSSVGAFGQQPSTVGAFGQQPSSVGAFGQQPSSVGSSGFAFSPAGSFGSLPFSGSQAGSASSTSFSNPSTGQSAETSGFSLGTVDKQQVRRKVKVKR